MKAKLSLWNQQWFVGIVMVLLLQGCNTGGGQKAGESFCNCMSGKINDATSPAVLTSAKEGCEARSLQLLKEAEDKYTSDAKRLSEIDMEYKNATQKTYMNYSTAISKAIQNVFSKSIWVKEGETKPENYLFSFAAGNITPVNEKGEFTFSFSGDTLNLDDDKRTRLLIHFDSEQKFSVSNLEESSTAHYHLASNQEKLIGYWLTKAGTPYVFKPNNTYGWSYQSIGNEGKYSWNENEITLSEKIWNDPQRTSRTKLTITDINQITLPVPPYTVPYGQDYVNSRFKPNKILNVTSLYR